ncbi:MAG: SPASM domain-containing protein [Candidatus Omnitrophica bacterium]|nr:SPASM domain-containing protein [Candidatus Omnitrophota bacterium]
MSLAIKNKNKYLYAIRVKLESAVYRHVLLRNGYLGLRQMLLLQQFHGFASGDMLFKKIFIETISYCNNNCAFCPASTAVGMKEPQHRMSERLYEKIIKELEDMAYPGSVAFHGNNEPFLDNRLAEWIAYARRHLKNNFFYLYTNGLAADITTINALFEKGINKVIINNYDDTHRLTPSLVELVRQEVFLKGETVIYYRRKNEYKGNRAGQSPNAEGELTVPLRFVCVRPFAEIVVGYDGTVPLCCADGLWKSVVGNVSETSISEVWFSPALKRVRDSLVKRDRSRLVACKFCDAVSFLHLKGNV